MSVNNWYQGAPFIGTVRDNSGEERYWLKGVSVSYIWNGTGTGEPGVTVSTQTITGVANIIGTSTQTITGVARVLATDTTLTRSTQTISGVARVLAPKSGFQYIFGVARVVVPGGVGGASTGGGGSQGGSPGNSFEPGPVNTYIFNTDLVAESGLRNAYTFTPVNPIGFINALATNYMPANGWTVVAQTTRNGAPSYTLRSAQSPWYDPLNIPASWDGTVFATMWVSGKNTVSFDIQNTSGSIYSPTAFTINIRSTDQPWRVIVCPFQVLAYPTNFIYYLDSGFIVSTLHVPDFIQRYGVTDCIIGATMNGWMTQPFQNPGSGLYAIRDAFGTIQWDGNSDARPQFVQMVTGPFAQAQVINKTNDPLTASSGLWYPFYYPAMVEWGTSFSSSKIRGWLWDSLLLAENKNRAATIKLDTITWYAGHTFENLMQLAGGPNPSWRPMSWLVMTSPAIDPVVINDV